MHTKITRLFVFEKNVSNDLETSMFYVVLITIDVAKNKGEGVTGVKCQYGSTAGESPEE